MQTLTAEPLTVTLAEMMVSDDDVKLKLELSYKIWQRALSEGLFHLDDEEEPATFEKDLPVQLNLRLRSIYAARWATDIETLTKNLNDMGSPIMHTEAWLATEILQEIDIPPELEDVSNLQIGLPTRWAAASNSSSTPASVIQILESFLESEGWNFTNLQEDFLQFHAGIDTDRGWVVLAHVDEQAGTCLLYSIHPNAAHQSKKNSIAQWLVEKNYELSEGCFDMNIQNGNIRYRTTFTASNREQVAAGVHFNLSVMAEYYDELTELLKKED